jgi:predicted DCC family thiol-disulfide oxidoreductase YuxK
MPNKYQCKPKSIKVFYDGDCRLCNKEIKFYQKLDKNSKFDWIDVNQNKDILNKYGLSYIDTQKIFHVIDKKGSVKKGIDGFLVIWREIKYWRILYFIVKMPIIKQLSNIIYNYFAKWRFKRKCNC